MPQLRAQDPTRPRGRSSETATRSRSMPRPLRQDDRSSSFTTDWKSDPGLTEECVSVRTQMSAFTLRINNVRRSRLTRWLSVGRPRFHVAIRSAFTVLIPVGSYLEGGGYAIDRSS